jgi:hypothetical protein
VPILAIHRDAAIDLQGIKASGRDADHGVILAFLQQAKVDPALLETLAEDWFGEDGSANYTIRKVIAFHQLRKRLWRVKVLTVKGIAAGYRVIYTFDAARHTFYVLGIPPREIAYDETHPRIKQILAAYDRLGLA